MLVVMNSSHRTSISLSALVNNDELNEEYNINNMASYSFPFSQMSSFMTTAQSVTTTARTDSSSSEDEFDTPTTPNSPASGNKRLRRGWTKDEHVRFLVGVFVFGRGNWKNISQIIQGKSPKQVQSHAQKFFLRQQQHTKSKRSIHDFDFGDLLVLLKDQGYREYVANSDKQLHKLLRDFEENYSESRLNACINNPGTTMTMTRL